jgi:glycosyltransferase involved in cell wall biosynthesis
VRTLIEDGISGRLVPRGDVDALAAAMRELATMSPEERARMGAAGRAHCERKYAWPVVLDVLDGVYADALASRTTRGSSSSAA